MTLMMIAFDQVVLAAMTVAIVMPNGENILTWMGIVLEKEIR